MLFVLLSASLYAESKIYLGVNYGNLNENFNNSKAESSSDALKIEIGYGIREAYAIEFSAEAIENKANIFSNNDGKKYNFNIELVKSFDYDLYLLPYMKAGFGAGYLEIERELQTKLNYGSFNLELGVLLPINEHYDFELGYSYKSISYESIDTIATQVTLESNLNTLYFGFNIRY